MHAKLIKLMSTANNIIHIVDMVEHVFFNCYEALTFIQCYSNEAKICKSIEVETYYTYWKITMTKTTVTKVVYF